jgi:prepilin-type N-terminal cleavage/methylation domain-containing protein
MKEPIMRTASLRNNKQGSTLIEIMVASVIFAVAIIASGTAVQLSRNSIGEQRNKHAALCEAIRIMELAQVSPDLFNAWSDVALYEDVDEDTNEDVLRLGAPSTPWQVSINGQLKDVSASLEIDHLGIPGLLQVTASVEYEDGRQIELKTLITDY